MTIERGDPRVLLVGELNPLGSNPYFALYHLPRGASGDRLRVILGLPDHAYARRLAKVNLCAGRFSTRVARGAARLILETRREDVLVLLGSLVREAFDGPRIFERQILSCPGPGCSGSPCQVVLLGLPHPSGRNLLWRDPVAVGRAREAFRAVAPWVYEGLGTEAPAPAGPDGDPR